MASGKFHGLKHMQRRTVLSSAWGAWVGMGALSLFSAPSRAAAFSQLDATTAVRTALDRGADIAVQQLGQQGGFLNNDKVRIQLPDVLQKATPLLRAMGKGHDLDELVTGMNHAAESAVPLALPLLKSAIKGMSVEDATKIVSGGDHSVTDFFAGKTRQPLTEQFLPVVTKSIGKSPLVKQYNSLVGKAGSTGLVKSEQSTVQQYVTAKALDGLYFIIGEEERRIRRDPVGTGSAILKKVFSGL